MTTWLQVVEVGLKYSKTIASMFVFVVSLTGYGVYDFVETTEANKNKAIHEVTAGFQRQIVLVEPKEVGKVKEDNCNNCRSVWLKDIKKNKEELEDKYHK